MYSVVIITNLPMHVMYTLKAFAGDFIAKTGNPLFFVL